MTHGLPLNDNDIVHFNCRMCGECCSGLMKVRLNPYDLYLMARRLKLKETGLLINKTVELLREENGLYLPYLRFKQRPFPFCPFLENRIDDDNHLTGLCRLHRDDKPLVCRMSPVGRSYDSLTDKESFFFLAPLDNCPGQEAVSKITVEKWISPWKKELEKEKKFFHLLDSFLERKIPEESLNLYYFKITEDFDKVFNDIIKRSRRIR